MNTSSIPQLGTHAVSVDSAHAQPLPPDQRALIQAVKAVNATEPFGSDNELTFRLDPASKRAVVRIVNRKSGDLVEQIPDEYVLRLAEEIKGR